MLVGGVNINNFSQQDGLFVSARHPLHFYPVLKSVIMTVECLTWLLVMYFLPPPNIWFDYQSNIGKILKFRFDWKSLAEDTPNK